MLLNTRYAMIAVACALAVGCSHRETCDLTSAPGRVAVYFTAVDSLSGQRLNNVRVITTFDARTDTAFVNSTNEYPLIIGHSSGTYHVEVQVPGYQPLVSDVVVGRVTACLLSYDDYTAKLLPAS